MQLLSFPISAYNDDYLELDITWNFSSILKEIKIQFISVSIWYCVLYCNCDKVICSWHNCPKKRAQKTYPKSLRPSKERHLAVILLVENGQEQANG